MHSAPRPFPYCTHHMNSSLLGLKEYADGEATLCVGDATFADDDLGALEQWLTDVSAAQPNFTFRTVPSMESFDFDLGHFDYLTQEAEAEEEKKPTCTPSVVFEEDPLSCLLNTSNSFVSSQEIKASKRGRKPKSTTFTPPPSSSTRKRPRRSFPFTPTSKQTSNHQVQYRHKRFPEDVYSPLLVRGRGADREGCCPLCSEPPVWLKIKQSAYWYHLNFYHGICASTGRPYEPPAELHFESIPGKPESVRVEGLCLDCNEWIIIAAEKPRLALDYPKNAWYKHAQKCQSRPLTDIEYPESLL